MKKMYVGLAGLFVMTLSFLDLGAVCNNNEKGHVIAHKKRNNMTKVYVCNIKPKNVKNTKLYKDDFCKLCGCSSADHQQ